jgi:PKHD-type hydroxylase
MSETKITKTVTLPTGTRKPWLSDTGLLIPDNWKTVNDLYIKDFLSDAECDDILEWAKKKTLAPCPGGEYVPIKVGINNWSDDKYFDWLYVKILELIKECNDQYFNYDILGFMEDIRVHKFTSYDNWYKDLGQDYTSLRKLSLHILLNNDMIGGEMKYFSSGEKEFEHKKGAAILHPSWLEHKISPVVSGEVYYLHAYVSGPAFR